MQLLGLFFVLSLLAEILGTVGGFGSSVFFVPIAGFFMDFQSVLGITAIFHLSSNITKIALFRQGINWKIVLLIGIPSVLFVSLGAVLTKNLDDKPLSVALGIFLILTSIIFLVFRKIQLKANAATGIGSGVLSGFLAGLLGSGGPIRGLTLAAYNMPKEVFVATSALIDLGIDATRTGVYFTNGYIHKHDLYLIPILLVATLAGTWIGKKLLEKISQEMFRKITLVLILITGIVTVVGVFTKSN